jgi:hypothetical protein
LTLEGILLLAYFGLAAIVMTGFWALVFGSLRCLLNVFRPGPKKED